MSLGTVVPLRRSKIFFEEIFLEEELPNSQAVSQNKNLFLRAL